jgi:hypothetical protein
MRANSDQKQAELFLIESRAAESYRNNMGYWDDLRRWDGGVDASFKLQRLIDAHPSVATDLRAWAERWSLVLSEEPR